MSLEAMKICGRLDRATDFAILHSNKPSLRERNMISSVIHHAELAPLNHTGRSSLIIYMGPLLLLQHSARPAGDGGGLLLFFLSAYCTKSQFSEHRTACAEEHAETGCRPSMSRVRLSVGSRSGTDAPGNHEQRRALTSRKPTTNHPTHPPARLAKINEGCPAVS